MPITASATAQYARTLEVWEWCREAYAQNGINLRFPPHTEPTTTYQWRYAKAIACKLDAWNFDDHTAKHFINVAAAYAKERHIAHKGLAALLQDNLLQVCKDRFTTTNKRTDQTLDIVRAAHVWLDARCDGDRITCLLQRRNSREYCNIVKWYKAAKLPPAYLALSRSCTQALARLSKINADERGIAPSAAVLYGLRLRIINDPINANNARAIIHDDWRR